MTNQVIGIDSFLEQLDVIFNAGFGYHGRRPADRAFHFHLARKLELYPSLGRDVV